MDGSIWHKFLRFCIVGGISTVVNYGIFYFLYIQVGINYVASSVAGYVSGLLVGYLLNKYWTFTDHVKKGHQYFFGYLAVYTVSLIASQAALICLVEGKLAGPLIANCFAIGLSTITNFVGLNTFVFKTHDTEIE